MTSAGRVVSNTILPESQQNLSLPSRSGQSPTCISYRQKQTEACWQRNLEMGLGNKSKKKKGKDFSLDSHGPLPPFRPSPYRVMLVCAWQACLLTQLGLRSEGASPPSRNSQPSAAGDQRGTKVIGLHGPGLTLSVEDQKMGQRESQLHNRLSAKNNCILTHRFLLGKRPVDCQVGKQSHTGLSLVRQQPECSQPPLGHPING
ncbi:hypothetical protein AAY473_008909 [Plecturocebus cupreus]